MGISGVANKDLIVVITMTPEGKVRVEGTIMNEIVTFGLIEKGKQVLQKHYGSLDDTKIVKPDLDFVRGLG